METLKVGSFRDLATAKCYYKESSCSTQFGFQKTETDLQFNFRLPRASRLTEGFSLSSWQNICCAYFSLTTLRQGKHQATKTFSSLPHSVNDEPENLIGIYGNNQQTLKHYEFT